LDHPSRGHHHGSDTNAETSPTIGGIDERFPMLVYVSREKNPSFDHSKKAQLRASALLSNGQLVINFDCDHYI
jgi:mixed-linked glucan synthase